MTEKKLIKCSPSKTMIKLKKIVQKKIKWVSRLQKFTKGIQKMEKYLFKKNLQKELCLYGYCLGLLPSPFSSSFASMVDKWERASYEKQQHCCWRGIAWFGVEHWTTPLLQALSKIVAISVANKQGKPMTKQSWSCCPGQSKQQNGRQARKGTRRLEKETTIVSQSYSSGTG